MLWTLVFVIAAAWVFGLVTSYTMGGLIHILLVVGILLAFLAVSRGRAAERQRQANARVHTDDHGGHKSYRAGGTP